MALATLSLLLVPYSLWRGAAPTASMEQAGWLALSGILHMAVGDAFYYEAIIMIGPRRAVQFLTLIPVSAVAVAWVGLGEAMTGTKLAGIAAVVGANSYLAWAEARIQHLPTREPGRISPMGVLCGVLAGLCIGGGAVFTRRAYLAGPLDPILGTTIRSAAATAVLWAMPLAMVARGLCCP